MKQLKKYLQTFVVLLSISFQLKSDHIKIVFTGSPRTGKTTVLEKLKEKDYYVLDEAATEVIKQYQKEEKNPRSNPKKFQEDIINFQLGQISEIPKKAKTVIFDRSFVDSVAYVDYYSTTINTKLRKDVLKYKYDLILFFKVNPNYEKTGDRLEESGDEEIKINLYLKNLYEEQGYKNIIEIPYFEKIEDKIEYVQKIIEDFENSFF